MNCPELGSIFHAVLAPTSSTSQLIFESSGSVV
jgi:hypothetical protein